MFSCSFARRELGPGAHVPVHAQIDGLDDVAGEEQLDRPVGHHPHITIQSRWFLQVNRAPQQPGEEAGEPQTLDLGAGGVVANDALRAECSEVERSELSAVSAP